MKKIILIAVLILITSGFTVSKKIDAIINKEIKTVFNIESYSKTNFVVSNEINKTLPLKITGDNFFKI